jgi:AraC family transcriptional regulator
MTSNLTSTIKPNQWLNKFLMLSSKHLGWNGIVVEQYQTSSTSLNEYEFPALSNHWLTLPLGHPAHVTQKRDNRLHESVVQKGECIFVPAGQPSYRRSQCQENIDRQLLHIYLQPKLIIQVAEVSDLNGDRIDLVNYFSKPDLQLQQIAMLLLAELECGGAMGQLYAESLTQVLAIHLLRHYSTVTQPITSENRSLTRSQVQQAIDYIHTHLDRDLSLAEIADVVNISPTYFASLFKRAMGISPHQYVIQQRVERAQVMLTKTDLAIADIALQVGFSSQSHLTQQFKRLTGMTPKQVR